MLGLKERAKLFNWMCSHNTSVEGYRAYDLFSDIYFWKKHWKRNKMFVPEYLEDADKVNNYPFVYWVNFYGKAIRDTNDDIIRVVYRGCIYEELIYRSDEYGKEYLKLVARMDDNGLIV